MLFQNRIVIDYVEKEQNASDFNAAQRNTGFFIWFLLIRECVQGGPLLNKKVGKCMHNIPLAEKLY
jgi:hypothetical protein